MILLQFFCIFFCLVSFFGSCKRVIHTNEFAVYIPGPGKLADSVAAKYGFINKGQVGSLTGYYRFVHDRIQKRSTDPSFYHTDLLKNDSMVHWCEQQIIRTRVKRSSNMKDFSSFTDPLYSEQWFLHADYGGYDMNVEPAWKQGYTGKGVVVSILDDGIQGNHPDLALNYDKEASWDINDEDDDPSPKDDDDNKHGTRCAGEVAAVANNEFCGVGVAYNAKIGGVRMLDGRVTDTIEATALSHKPNHIDIYSASWGPEDDGKTVDGPGPLAKMAFEDGIKKGRNGRGSIYVWASGNGGKLSDNCNCDGYTNSIYTISISSATENGFKPWYLEECSSTLATTYSSGTTTTDRNIVTVDVNYAYFEELKQQKKPNHSTLCTKKHTGTSASAPIAAGLCALALEANPNLTWREMQYIIVLTSRYTPLSKEDGWISNGANRKISTKFGYGLMDGDAMVKVASNWKTLDVQHVCSTTPDQIKKIIPKRRGEHVEATIYTDGCKNTQNFVRYAEHVQVRVSLSFYPRGNLHIILVSPNNTTSSILLPRPHDAVIDQDSFNDWPFMSVHFWGEEVTGPWKLIIYNVGKSNSELPGSLTNWSITYYGSEDIPDCVKDNSCKENKHEKLDSSEHTYPIRDISVSPDMSSNKCKADKKFLFVSEKVHSSCIAQCPAGFYADTKDYKCQKCDDSCHTCYGPSYNNCLMCETSFLLNSTCIKHCPEGYFPYFETDPKYSHQCVPCSSSCVACKESMHKCVLCSDRFHLNNDGCLPYCPPGSYSSENRCMRCSKECQLCFGPLSSDCLTCSNGYYLLDRSCVNECPKNHYIDDEKRCIRCHRSCESCNDPNHCITCDRSKFWFEDPRGDCQFQGCSLKPDYPRGPYPSDPCFCEQLEGCKTCLEDQLCDICNLEYQWFDGKCHKQCPISTYLHFGECKECLGKCFSCENNPYFCTACQNGFYFHKNGCLVTCPTGYYETKQNECGKCHPSCVDCDGASKYHCLSCSSEKYLLNNSCTYSCPSGYYIISHDFFSENNAFVVQECVACHPSCKTCTEYGPYFCTSCHQDRFLAENTCIPCLDGHFFDFHKKVCERCHDDCGTCFGPSQQQCSSCLAPLRLDKLNHVCMPCCLTGFSEDCCICSDDLDFCIGNNPYAKNQSNTVNIPQATFSEQLATVAITISVMAILGFFILFGILQCRSSKSLHHSSRGKDYLPVPREMNAMFHADQEKVSLTQADAEEEDDLFLKT